jgi:hypothetical protein
MAAKCLGGTGCSTLCDACRRSYEQSEEQKRDWLLRQIEEATKNVAGWPDWMKRVAHFDGAPRD